MFPLLGLLTVCSVAVVAAVAIIAIVPGIRLTVGNVLIFTVAAVPSSFASAFLVGTALGERYTFAEGIAALSIGGLAGGLAGVLLKKHFVTGAT